MSKKHKYGPDGILEDGVRVDPATSDDLNLYVKAQHELSVWRVPVLIHVDNPHERLVMIHLDGTGNDMVHDPEHKTNIAMIYEGVRLASKTNSHIHAIYEQGPGTEENTIARTLDAARGFTYNKHINNAYVGLIRQVKVWKDEDPHAQVRVGSVGFSRAGDEVGGLTRLIDEMGIKDPRDVVVHHHAFGGDTYTFTSKYPPLVPPGQTMQAVMLFDPVGTGEPYRHDRQLPPTVVSGFQITARDERRDEFPSTQIIPEGRSADGRFLQMTLAGAHSDIGNSYHHDGLALLNLNLAVRYINGWSDKPLLQEYELPQDPHMYVIHHSEDHEIFYTTHYAKKHGERDVRGAQVGAPDCRATIQCLPPEPLSPAIAAQITDRRPITIAPLPLVPSIAVARPASAQVNAGQDRQRQMQTEQAQREQVQMRQLQQQLEQMRWQQLNETKVERERLEKERGQAQEREASARVEHMPLPYRAPEPHNSARAKNDPDRLPAMHPSQVQQALHEVSPRHHSSSIHADVAIARDVTLEKSIAIDTAGRAAAPDHPGVGVSAPEVESVSATTHRQHAVVEPRHERSAESPGHSAQAKRAQSSVATGHARVVDDPAHTKGTNHQQVPTSAQVRNQPEKERDPNSLEARIDRMLAAAAYKDWGSFRKDTQAFAAMQPGRDLIDHGKDMVTMQRQLTQQHHAEMQQMQQTLQHAMQQQHTQQRSQGRVR